MCNTCENQQIKKMQYHENILITILHAISSTKIKKIKQSREIKNFLHLHSNKNILSSDDDEHKSFACQQTIDT